MLISICGPQGTGKTTLLKDLKLTISANIISRKTARSVLNEWNISSQEIYADQSLTQQFQQELLTRKIQDDSLNISNNSLRLTERTFTDLFTYALIYLGPHNTYSDWINNYFNQCKEANKIYNLVFYLAPGHFNTQCDHVRSHNEYFSELVHNNMLHFSTKMYDNNTKFVIIDTPCMVERKEIIINHLLKYKETSDETNSSCSNKI